MAGLQGHVANQHGWDILSRADVPRRQQRGAEWNTATRMEQGPPTQGATLALNTEATRGSENDSSLSGVTKVNEQPSTPPPSLQLFEDSRDT